MTEQTIPEVVKNAKIGFGRFIVLDGNGNLYTQTDCVHVARDYGSRGHKVWKLSGSDLIPPFEFY